MLTFQTERLTDRVTRIYAFATELMYLVEGDERAALLDTGSGLGSLKACVEQLTDKPVIVLVTHGHTDHALGAAEFDTVYMNQKDLYVYRPHSAEAFRREGFDMLTDGMQYEETDIIPAAPEEKFLNLDEGDSFDLGGVHIDIYACPGHTLGSLVMLIREERALLLGDACNNFTFVYDAYSTSIAEYEENLKRLASITDGKYDTVYLSHGDGWGHKDILRDMIDLCEDIKAGRTDDLPMNFRGDSALIAQVPGDGGRKNGKHGNIVYRKEQIYHSGKYTDRPDRLKA